MIIFFKIILPALKIKIYFALIFDYIFYQEKTERIFTVIQIFIHTFKIIEETWQNLSFIIKTHTNEWGFDVGGADLLPQFKLIGIIIA